MFLRRRINQLEYFDAPRPEAEVRQFFEALERLNRLCLFALPFVRRLPRLAGKDSCRSLSILDLGAGDGLLGRILEKWAGRRGWKWRVTNLDANPTALGIKPAGREVAGSVLALPFRNGSFDAVVASQMTHHLTDAQVERHLGEAWRVTRGALLISDLHRSSILYGMLWGLLPLLRFPPHFRNDGLLSVRRSWRSRELLALAQAAGIPGPRVRLFYGGRVLVEARKGI